MTLLAPAPATAAAPGAGSGSLHPVRRWLPHVAMLAVLVTWAVPFTHATGGRDPQSLLVLGLVLLAALASTGAWRLPARHLVGAAGVAVAALLVCVVSPTGWYGADVAAGYVVAAVAYVVTCRYAGTERRTWAVLTAVVLAGVEQFSQAFLPWWGGGDPAASMSGTFYWHNPYAAFLLPGALLGFALVLRGAAPWRAAGWVGAPVCVAGVVFSSSRATLAVLLVAWVAVGALVVRDRGAARRATALSVLAVGIVLVLPGPPFFGHWHSPLAAADQRAAAGESLGQNGFYRTEFWREAIAVAEHNPVSGAGFHSLGTASARYTPVGWARSPLAHDGYLQALSDGGLLLGAPFLLALLGLASAAVRRLWSIARQPRAPGPLPGTALAVVLLAAMAHSAVDFDWSHPAVLVQLAIVGGCLTGPGPTHDRARRGSPRRLLPFVAVSLLAAAVVVDTVALPAWQRSTRAGAGAAGVASALEAATAPFGDYRAARFVLEQSLVRPEGVTRAQARLAWRETAAAGAVDRHLTLLRDAVAAQRGFDPRAVEKAAALVRSVDGDPAPYILDLAQVEVAAGRIDAARAALRGELAARAAAGAVDPDTVAELQLLARLPGAAHDYACLAHVMAPVLGAAAVAGLPTPTAPATGCAAALATGQAPG